MKFVCDAPGGKVWFLLETELEASTESALMEHAVEKHFRRCWEQASASYEPGDLPFIERDIGRAAHIRRTMPLFATLRDENGVALATAMVRPAAQADTGFRPIIVGKANADPYPEHHAAIEALAEHLGVTLDRDTCYPYRR